MSDSMTKLLGRKFAYRVPGRIREEWVDKAIGALACAKKVPIHEKRLSKCKTELENLGKSDASPIERRDKTAELEKEIKELREVLRDERLSLEGSLDYLTVPVRQNEEVQRSPFHVSIEELHGSWSDKTELKHKCESLAAALSSTDSVNNSGLNRVKLNHQGKFEGVTLDQTPTYTAFLSVKDSSVGIGGFLTLTLGLTWDFVFEAEKNETYYEVDVAWTPTEFDHQPPDNERFWAKVSLYLVRLCNAIHIIAFNQHGGLLDEPSVPSEGCYVATCAYGSYDCPQVWTLRRFRDEYLKNRALGRAFVKAYYTLSPKLVTRYGSCAPLRNAVRTALDKFVVRLNKRGYSSLPYNDK